MVNLSEIATAVGDKKVGWLRITAIKITFKLREAIKAVTD
jgi:hypothetical protein